MKPFSRKTVAAVPLREPKYHQPLMWDGQSARCVLTRPRNGAFRGYKRSSHTFTLGEITGTRFTLVWYRRGKGRGRCGRGSGWLLEYAMYLFVFYQMKCVTAGMFPCLGTQYWHFLFLPYTVGRPERFDSGLTCPFTLLYTGTDGHDFILLFFFKKRSPQTTISAPQG